MDSAKSQLRKDVYELFVQIKDEVGTCADMDALLSFVLTKYSLNFKFKAKKGSGNEGMGSCGVTKQR